MQLFLVCSVANELIASLLANANNELSAITTVNKSSTSQLFALHSISQVALDVPNTINHSRSSNRRQLVVSYHAPVGDVSSLLTFHRMVGVFITP